MATIAQPELTPEEQELLQDEVIVTPADVTSLRAAEAQVRSSVPSKFDTKVCLEGSDAPQEVEIRPRFFRRLEQEKAFILDMVDADGNICAISMEDGTFITSLKLAPNPDTLIINSAKIISRYNTMTRWVEEHWGDEIDTITLSGYTFSFTALLQNSAPGLSLGNRDRTAPYQYMRNIITFFKKNGYLFQDNSSYYPPELLDADVVPEPILGIEDFLAFNPEFKLSHPRAGMIRERLYVRMRFDYLSLFGHFETLDVTEDSNNPYRFYYSLVFKSEKTKYLLG